MSEKNVEAVKQPIQLTMWEAFSTAQAECESAIKNKNNGHLKYNYADINSYLELLKLSFGKYGFSLIQLNSQKYIDGIWYLELKTKVIFKDGQIAIDNTSQHVINSQDISNPQKVGSYITYYRKYALQCVFGLSAEDNDAQDLQSKYENKAKLKLTPTQIAMINFELSRRDIDTEKFMSYLVKKYGSTLENLVIYESDFNNIVEMIVSKKLLKEEESESVQ